jgi:hypothetical protein
MVELLYEAWSILLPLSVANDVDVLTSVERNWLSFKMDFIISWLKEIANAAIIKKH